MWIIRHNRVHSAELPLRHFATTAHVEFLVCKHLCGGSEFLSNWYLNDKLVYMSCWGSSRCRASCLISNLLLSILIIVVIARSCLCKSCWKCGLENASKIQVCERQLLVCECDYTNRDDKNSGNAVVLIIGDDGTCCQKCKRGITVLRECRLRKYS